MGQVKVLHIATRHRFGGAERNVVNMLEQELDRGWDVHFAVHPAEFQPTLPSRVRVHFITQLVRDVAAKDAIAIRELRQLIRTERFDMVHTHQSKAGVVGRIAAWRGATIIVHSIHMPSFGPAYGAVQSSVFRLMERFCALITDRFIAVGSQLRDIYVDARIGDRSQYTVIPSPIEVSRFSGIREATAEQRETWRRQFQIPREAQVILSIGALDRRKRHDVALRHLAPELRRGKLIFLIAGEGPEIQGLERQALDLDVEASVRFLGFVPDIAPLLGVADALVHLSTVEGVPQVVVQAMAAGVPVIASSMEGLAEIESPPILLVERSCARLGEALSVGLSNRAKYTLDDVGELDIWEPRQVNKMINQFHDGIEVELAERTKDGPIGSRKLRRPRASR